MGRTLRPDLRPASAHQRGTCWRQRWLLVIHMPRALGGTASVLLAPLAIRMPRVPPITTWGLFLMLCAPSLTRLPLIQWLSTRLSPCVGLERGPVPPRKVSSGGSRRIHIRSRIPSRSPIPFAQSCASEATVLSGHKSLSARHIVAKGEQRAPESDDDNEDNCGVPKH
jgi:hypothetical protein